MKVSAVRWVFVAKDELEPGRLVRLKESGGRVLWEVCEGEMSPEALEELNIKYAAIAQSGLWTAELDESEASESPGQVVDARYVIVPEDMVPSLKGELFVTHEEGRMGTAMMPEGHLTPALRDQLNTELEEFLGRGMWTLWPGREADR